MKEYFFRALTRPRREIDFKRLGRIVDKLLVILCVVSLSADLFLICARVAEAGRAGVGKIGGEYFILLIPVVVYLIIGAIKDIKAGGTDD